MTGFPLALPLDVTAPRHFAVLERSFADNIDATALTIEDETNV